MKTQNEIALVEQVQKQQKGSVVGWSEKPADAMKTQEYHTFLNIG